MDVLIVPKTLASLEYTALRLPLTFVEKQVVARFLEPESGARLGFERALGSLDVTVARWIGDADRASRGAALSRKADMLTKAVQLERKAAARKEKATSKLQQARDTAEQQRQQAQQRAKDNLLAIRTEQRSDTQAAHQKASAQARANTAAVERERTAKLDAEKSRLEGKVKALDARTSARTAAPAAQLDDAVELSRSAAEQRQTAARLGTLAGTEKASRQNT